MTKTNEPYSTGPIGNHQSNIIYRTHGRRHGLVTPLMSQSDLGEVLQPFAFLDLVNADAKALSSFALHPHSGIATLTHFFEGNVRHEDTTGAGGLLLEGGVEWFKAGHGAWHGGGESTRARGFQLWLALPPEHELGPVESICQAPEDIARSRGMGRPGF
jgi:redox-sensitive bicupin YhaK (pirin superfamily)